METKNEVLSKITMVHLTGKFWHVRLAHIAEIISSKLMFLEIFQLTLEIRLWQEDLTICRFVNNTKKIF